MGASSPIGSREEQELAPMWRSYGNSYPRAIARQPMSWRWNSPGQEIPETCS